ATALEKAAGRNPTPQKMQQAVKSVLQKIIKQHKRVIFNGDGYSQEWHNEAKRRGLPNFRDTVESLPTLKSKKTVDLFRKYNVLSRAETESRYHIFIEKFIKQVSIEAETMVSVARTMILPAALEHQARLAEAIGATLAADVDCEGQRAMLEKFVGLVDRFRAAIDTAEKAADEHMDDPSRHALHIKTKVRPALDALRSLADELEEQISSELWPLATYRELLFIK
ncbi:MAG TPA: hypothetical protein PK308_07135, partial [Phycisphaerales bacterium]|nr:hypothetical protein [Phycisphaerales bacterium]